MAPAALKTPVQADEIHEMWRLQSSISTLSRQTYSPRPTSPSWTARNAVIPLNNLCEVCTVALKVLDLANSWREGWMYQTVEWHDSVVELTFSIKKECHFCTRVGAMLVGRRDFSPAELALSDPLFLRTCVTDETHYMYRRFISLNVAQNHSLPLLEVLPPKAFKRTESNIMGTARWRFIVAWKTMPYRRDETIERFRISIIDSRVWTASDLHMKLISRWFDDCVEQYELCRQQTSLTSLPTRLIEFSHYTEPLVRLCVTSCRDSSAQYCALSHCWGGAGIIKLTSKTFADF
jgi:hypothetical protein